MQLVEHAGIGHKAITRLHDATIRQLLPCVHTHCIATRYAGGGHAADTQQLNANRAAAAAGYQQGVSCSLSKIAPHARQYIKHTSGSAQKKKFYGGIIKLHRADLSKHQEVG